MKELSDNKLDQVNGGGAIYNSADCGAIYNGADCGGAIYNGGITGTADNTSSSNICGAADNNSSINNCYNTGKITL